MFSKLVRIGRDAELRYTAGNKAVVGLACVYDIGWGDKKKGQWLEAVIWGKQAEALAPYLLKGQQVVIYADDIELETYPKNGGGEGSKLKCRVVNIDLTDNPNGSRTDQGVQQQSPQQQAQNNGFDDDIPF
jgi:single-strand DNA-binding protein